ncbi:MAG: DUF805 domain-containing protein [Chloroflexi bacterium]|jgi:DNA-binding CsgD family transcriptional regulator|nr:DUF805 domain-containing protein [Chloroflexota bacterium]
MDQLTGLSKREREVVELLLEGKSNKQIALSLHITGHTVEFHLKNIYSKCQVSSRTELILKLGNSVVAGRHENVENGDGFTLSNWSTSLRTAVSKIGKEIKLASLPYSNDRNGTGPMTFFESILVCFKKYAEFTGRASRSEFWWFLLFVTLVGSALAYVSETLVSIFMIAILLPLLAAGARRLTDSGKSAWLQLYLLVPVGGIVMLAYWWAQPTQSPQADDTLPA